MESLSMANKKRAFLSRGLASGTLWSRLAKATGHVLTAGVGGVEGSAFCPLRLAREPRSAGRESPSARPQRNGGGGDGVPAAASPETLGDPPDSGGRARAGAGARTRPRFSVSVGYLAASLVGWSGD